MQSAMEAIRSRLNANRSAECYALREYYSKLAAGNSCDAAEASARSRGCWRRVAAHEPRR